MFAFGALSINYSRGQSVTGVTLIKCFFIEKKTVFTLNVVFQHFKKICLCHNADSLSFSLFVIYFAPMDSLNLLIYINVGNIRRYDNIFIFILDNSTFRRG